jgi:hypothetical protein
MNWPAAKRLAISLGQVIRQYEERNGEIKIQQAPAPVCAEHRHPMNTRKK